jgi:hypothetical protein
MNPRQVKKLIQRRPHRGRIALHLPLSLFPPQPPPVHLDGFEADGNGWWRGPNEQSLHIHRWSSTEAPEPKAHETIAFVERDSHGTYTWWTGGIVQHADDGTVHNAPIDEALITKHKTCAEWHDAMWEYGHGPFRNAIVNVYERAGVRMSFEVEQDYVVVWYRMKRSYRHLLDEHAAHISRVIALGRKIGVEVRVGK